jgi:hypothetical protein
VWLGRLLELAIMSQVPPIRRRLFQFGLGTMFVLIMAFALGLMVGQRAKQTALEGGWRGIGKEARFRMFVQSNDGQERQE